MTETNDSFRYADRLREILNFPQASFVYAQDEDEDTVEEMCYLITLMLGQCALRGIVLPTDIDVPRFRFTGTHAAIAASRVAMQTALHLSTLDEQVADAESQFEVDEAVCSPLESRMDMWAVVVGLEDIIGNDDSCDESVTFRESYGQLLKAVARLDIALRNQADLLMLAAETELLENFRNELAPPYSDALPWWLDGSMERELVNSQESRMPQIVADVATSPKPDENQDSPAAENIAVRDQQGAQSVGRQWIRYVLAASVLLTLGFLGGRLFVGGSAPRLTASAGIDEVGSRSVPETNDIAISISSNAAGFASIIMIIEGEDLIVEPSEIVGLQLEAGETTFSPPISNLTTTTHFLVVVTKTSSAGYLTSRVDEILSRDPREVQESVRKILADGGHEQIAFSLTTYEPPN